MPRDNPAQVQKQLEYDPPKALPPPDRSSAPLSKRWKWAAIIAGVLLILLAIWGIVSRIVQEHDLQKETDDMAIPTVNVVQAKKSPDSEELVLPGNVQANVEAPIYARTSGYLKQWYTDIGTPVKAGQLLADIDTPEVDDQLRQAQANLVGFREFQLDLALI